MRLNEFERKKYIKEIKTQKIELDKFIKQAKNSLIDSGIPSNLDLPQLKENQTITVSNNPYDFIEKLSTFLFEYYKDIEFYKNLIINKGYLEAKDKCHYTINPIYGNVTISVPQKEFSNYILDFNIKKYLPFKVTLKYNKESILINKSDSILLIFTKNKWELYRKKDLTKLEYELRSFYWILSYKLLIDNLIYTTDNNVKDIYDPYTIKTIRTSEKRKFRIKPNFDIAAKYLFFQKKLGFLLYNPLAEYITYE